MSYILNIILIFALYRLHTKILTYRFPPKTIFPAYTIAYLLWTIAGSSYHWFPEAPLKFFLQISIIIYFLFLYEDNLGKRLFYVLFSLLIYTICELLVIFFMSTFFGANSSTLSSSSIEHGIAVFWAEFIFWLLVEIFIHYKSSNPSPFDGFFTELLLILCIDIAFMCVISSLFYYDNLFLTTATAINLALCSVALISMISVFTLYKVTKKSRETMETNLKLQQIEMENKLTENLEDVVNNLRSLRHDMNNHMGILQGLLSLGESQEALDYLNSISSELSVANQFVFVENKVLSVLINSKINKATTLGIPIETDILVNDFPLNDKDLCALIGNILENAIEAAEHAKHPHITFSMKKENQQFYVQCENTFLVTPILQNGEFLTTKENKKYHGIGIKNIKSIVETYHGRTIFSVDDLFHILIVIPY